MKIAIVSTSTYPTPPMGYGGESYFWHLCRGFCELGHEVILVASGGSRVPPRGKLLYIPCSYGDFSRRAESKAVEWYLDEILSCDLIIDCSHSRSVSEAIKFFHREKAKVTFQLLNGISLPRVPHNVIVGSKKWAELMLRGETQFKGTPWEKIYGSKLERPLKEDELAGVIYWRTDTNFYTPGSSREDYLLWIGRPSPYKGLHIAIKAAADLGIPLKVVMPVEFEEHARWAKMYEESISWAREKGARIELVSLPNNSKHQEMKRELMRRAMALMAPFQSSEPFGLVVIEALSCGTPVIASDIGAMPEIVSERVGFLCRADDVEDFKRAVRNLDKIDHRDCRKEAEEKWHYLKSCREILELLEKRS
ncbi:MAG: glycosyltransferase [Thermoplasmata archaeon]|nr:glycosyltransferase [Thermoplasmata archaeon]